MKKIDKFALTCAIITGLFAIAGIVLLLVSGAVGVFGDFGLHAKELFSNTGIAYNFMKYVENQHLPNFWINIGILAGSVLLFIIDLVWIVYIGKRKKPLHLLHFFVVNIAMFGIIVYLANFNSLVLPLLLAKDVFAIIYTICFGIAAITVLFTTIASLRIVSRKDEEEDEEVEHESYESRHVEYEAQSVVSKRTVVVEERVEEIHEPAKEAPSSTVIINNYYGKKDKAVKPDPVQDSGIPKGIQEALNIDQSIKKSNKKDN